MPYLSIDIGSSSVKAALIAESGRLIGLAKRASPLRHRGGGAHDSDPEEWVEGAAEATSELLAASPSIEIRAVAVSGNGPTLLAADAAGRPIGPALSWMDRRAVAEAAEVSALTEFPLDPSFYLPKALRLWRTSAAVRDRARWFFSCPEYLSYILSGVAITYLPHPGYSPYIWDKALLEALKLPLDRFPPFAAPGSRAGEVTKEAARRFGLRPGIPVIAGFPDFLASIAGSAVVEPGLACDRSGTSEALNICAVRPYPGRELLSLPHVVPGLWNLSAGLSTAGEALEWLALTASFSGPEGSPTTEEEATAALFSAALLSPPGARGLLFLPYLAGERAPLWDSSRRGAFLGLGLEHAKQDLARAACESLGFGLHSAAELATGAGFPLRLVRTSGAPSRNDFLSGLKSDILGLPVETPAIPDCELVGDACASAFALGEAASIAEAAVALVRIDRRFEPDAARHRAYLELYATFKSAVAALAPIDAMLARIRSGKA